MTTSHQIKKVKFHLNTALYMIVFCCIETIYLYTLFSYHLTIFVSLRTFRTYKKASL